MSDIAEILRIFFGGTPVEWRRETMEDAEVPPGVTMIDVRPPARVVKNRLVISPSLNDLTMELVLVELPGDMFIDVSWHPPHSEHGCYYISMFRRRYWDIHARSETAWTPYWAKRKVERMVEEYMAKRWMESELGSDMDK